MRTKEFALAAVILGGIGGYAWSSLTAPAPQAPAPVKATNIPLPASPEELPDALDEEWVSQSGDGPQPVTGPVASAAQEIHYAGCKEVRAAGKAPLHSGEPGYRTEMDGDGDGVACEPHHGV
jgi:Excalibur calcium-binding domain